MRPRPDTGDLAILGLLAAVALPTAPPASAHVSLAEWNNYDDYRYRIDHMPDLDQKRLGVPNNGSAYCVPTSSLNMLFYAANHGFDDITPGPANWQTPAMYGAAGLSEIGMGSWMGTDPDDGTTGSGWIDGVEAWLAPSEKFVVSHYGASGNWSPTFLSLSIAAHNGALVSFAYGRYEISAMGANNWITVGDRVSGHVVTLTRTERDAGTRELQVRNPSQDDGDLAAQSIFANQLMHVQEHTVWNGDWTRDMSSLEHPVGDGLVRLIDSYLTIKPAVGYSFDEPGLLEVYEPFGDFTGSQPAIQPFQLPPGFSILDSDFHPDLVGVLILLLDTAGRVELRRLDFIDGALATIAGIPGGRALATGRHRDAYVLADGVPDGDVIVHVPVDAAPPFESTAVPYGIDALAFDDRNDELVVLSLQDGKLLRYPAGLPDGAMPTDQDLPPGLPAGGAVAMAIHPDTHLAWLAVDGTDDLLELSDDGTGGLAATPVHVPGLLRPRSLAFHDSGRLTVATNTAVHEIVHDGAGWVPAPERIFGGPPAGPNFRVARSRTNYDPATMSGPGFRHVPPDELGEVLGQVIPDCHEDLNGDDIVDVGDLLQTLGEWGPCAGLASDLDGNGVVDVADLLAELAAWGACP